MVDGFVLDGGEDRVSWCMEFRRKDEMSFVVAVVFAFDLTTVGAYSSSSWFSIISSITHYLIGTSSSIIHAYIPDRYKM